MTRIFWLALCALTTLTSALNAQPMNNAPNRARVDDISEISLDSLRREGAGIASDKVVLRFDGTATRLQGNRQQVNASYRGRFDPDDFLRLAALVRSQRFFTLRTIYEKTYRYFPASVTSVTQGRTLKSVTNYEEAGPVELWGLEMAIRGIAAGIDWKDDTVAPPVQPSPSGIQGIARQGPISPVEREGVPNTKPLANALILVEPAGGGRVLASPQSDDNGKFQVVLPPGVYLLVPRAPDPDSPYPRAAPKTVTVRDGRFTDVTIDYDTGIR